MANTPGTSREDRRFRTSLHQTTIALGACLSVDFVIDNDDLSDSCRIFTLAIAVLAAMMDVVHPDPSYQIK
jgi:hypothetical protein